ncbi:hypothetical protein RHMOL_Rhmol08G0310000 [Rhododendron molle]|uniref:Uncharacterized protein n=1 Tax=Rhododendron molle TaxID=49168 RepID=A0ACC0MU80_RHOML|nr:hypothetical protein RHMOL_Rhmol08G0310000 [Rhododendron molle]
MKIPTDCSWTFRKLLRLRTVAFPFITKIIGNGESTFLWLDNWHPLGSLFSKFGNGIVFNLGRSLDARVSSIIADGCWRWPRARNAIVQKIIRHTPDNLVPHPDREDTKCNISRDPLPLRDEISWGLATGRSKSVHGLIFKLLFAASIYFLWGERNNRIFKAKRIPWQGVFDLIVENVRACLCGWRNVERTRENVRILEGWCVPSVVFM